jgi:UDP-N-acetylglucosamine 1-carboxyvinyltransferase
MSKLIIHGRKSISGTHRTPGNKNAALPMIAASLLTSEPVTLKNLPLIVDVRTTLKLVSELGAEVKINEAKREVTIHARKIRTKVAKELCGKVRSSILFAGPLLARCGAATLYPPGGDIIGRRRIDTHLEGLKTLGASIATGNSYIFKAPKGLTGAYILLDEASVTATENLIMAITPPVSRTSRTSARC